MKNSLKKYENRQISFVPPTEYSIAGNHLRRSKIYKTHFPVLIHVINPPIPIPDSCLKARKSANLVKELVAMRMSCNGCRVLRKGCSENCTIRPCLQWMKTPEAQSNATVFLAKFYGRAGLLNLINAGAQHLQPGNRCRS